jgi:DNA modification methylase
MQEVTIVRPHEALQRKQPALERLLHQSPCIMAQADSRDLIKKVPTASVDFILTDPPYNLNGYSTGDIKMGWRKHFNNDVAEWDSEEFKPGEWVSEFQRILKPTGNIFAFTSYNLLGKWHEVFDPVLSENWILLRAHIARPLRLDFLRTV